MLSVIVVTLVVECVIAAAGQFHAALRRPSRRARLTAILA